MASVKQAGGEASMGGRARRTLIVMAKAPLLGHGKSRLAAALGPVEALRINRFLHRRAMAAARDPRWRTVLAVAPDRALRLSLPGVWPEDAARAAQGGGDLGARLARAFRACRGAAAVIGTDCPAMTRGHVWSAFAALARAPFALGPCPDGGFWIFAARDPRRAAAAFAGVRWSTAHAAADLLARAPGRTSLLASLADVDEPADWRRFCGNRRQDKAVSER